MEGSREVKRVERILYAAGVGGKKSPTGGKEDRESIVKEDMTADGL